MENFKKFFLAFLKEKQNENFDTIMALPVDNSISYYDKIGVQRRHPIRSDDIDDETKSVLSKEAYRIGKEAANEFYEAIKDHVVVDLKGHFYVEGTHTLTELNDIGKIGNGTYWMKKDAIVNSLYTIFASAIYNFPVGNLTDEQEKFFIDEFTDSKFEAFRLFDVNRIQECTGCGQPLNILMNMETMKADLYEVHAYNSVNRSTFIALPKACSHFGKPKTFSHVINVSSGKIVFANDLRKLLKDKVSLDDYVTGKMGFTSFSSGSVEASNFEAMYYAERNIMYVPGTNSSTDIFKSEKGIILRNDFDDEEDCDQQKGSGSSEVNCGHVSMDRWMIMGMDFELFALLSGLSGKDVDKAIRDYDAVVVDVEPSDYEFTSMYLETREQSPEIYATLKRVE